MIEEILGFGAVLWDLTVHVDYSFLDEIAIEKGGYRAVDYQSIKEVLAKLTSDDVRSVREVIKNPGGSCANVMSTLAKLGSSASFSGKHGADADGRKFMALLTADSVKTHSIIDKEQSTGQVISFITPDKDRTFITYLGASEHLSAELVDESIVRKAGIVHMEGYLIGNSEEALWKIFENARKISFDLAAKSLIEQKRSAIQKLMTKYPPYILFANIFEGATFTQRQDRQAILTRLLDFSENAVLTLGEEGVLVASATGERHFEPAVPTTPADTTGAGDAFSAGFLHRFLKDGDIVQAAKLGARTASATIREIGARSFKVSKLKELFE